MRSVGGKDKSVRGSSSSKKFKSTDGPSRMQSTLALNEISSDTTQLGSSNLAFAEPTASAFHNHHDMFAVRSISDIARNQSANNNGTLMPAPLGTFPFDDYVLRQLSSLTSGPSLATSYQNNLYLPSPNANVPFQPSLATHHLSIMGCAPMNNPSQRVLTAPFVTNHSGASAASLPLGPQPNFATPLQTSWASTLAAARLDPCRSLANLPTLTNGNANLTASLRDRVCTGSSLSGLVPYQPDLLHSPVQLQPNASALQSGPDWLNGAMNHHGTLQDSLMASNPTVEPSLALQSDRLLALLAATESAHLPPQVSYSSVDATPPLPFVLTTPTDATFLSEFQLLLRRHIEVFPATTEDIESHVRGRSKPIRLHQIGLRCRHCAHVPPDARTPGSTYFPVSTLGLYQAAQNMSSTHLQCGLCPEMPESIKTEFATLLATKMPGRSSKGGRKYWSRNALDVGLVNAELGIFPGHLVPLDMSVVEPHKSTAGQRVD